MMLTNSPARGPNTPSTLVVGTSEGVLLVYDIVPSSDGTAGPTAVVASYADAARQPPQVNMREPLKTFAKNKPIMQLAIVEKYNMLISLSGMPSACRRFSVTDANYR